MTIGQIRDSDKATYCQSNLETLLTVRYIDVINLWLKVTDTLCFKFTYSLSISWTVKIHHLLSMRKPFSVTNLCVTERSLYNRPRGIPRLQAQAFNRLNEFSFLHKIYVYLLSHQDTLRLPVMLSGALLW